MNVEIYSKDGCGYCVAATNLLRQKGIKFTEMKLDVHVTRDFIKENFPFAKTFPVIVVDGMHIGGYNELTEEIKRLESGQILLRE